MLLTVALEPVDHEFRGQSTYGKVQVLKARVIESPVPDMDLGNGRAADTGIAASRTIRMARTRLMAPREPRDARTI